MLEIQLLKERLKLRTLKEEKSNLYPQGYIEAKRSETCNDCLNWIIRHFKTFPFHRIDQTRINFPADHLCSCWMEVIL